MGTESVASAVFSPDSRFVVTAGWDGTARVWEARAFKPCKDLTFELVCSIIINRN